ncbi:hypothetical protein ACFLYP_04335, partial [Chloroflexota bacterium]
MTDVTLLAGHPLKIVRILQIRVLLNASITFSSIISPNQSKAISMKLLEKLPPKKFGPNSVPWILILFAILAFGLYLGWVGFYWDDWIWVYFSHQLGPDSLTLIDQAHRPLAGQVLRLGAALAGESPLGWQVYNFVFRILTALSFWWMLRQLWPDKGG